MFNWNTKKQTRPFTYKEDVFVKTLMIGLRDHCEQYGAFLQEVNLNDITFKWLSCAENSAHHTVELWSIRSPNTIYLTPYITSTSRTTVYSIGDEKTLAIGDYLLNPTTAKTVAYQLMLRWKFKSSPIFYLLNCLCNRSFKINNVSNNSVENRTIYQFFKKLKDAYDQYINYQKSSWRREVYQADNTKSAEDCRLAIEQEQLALDQYQLNEPMYRDLAKQLFNIMK